MLLAIIAMLPSCGATGCHDAADYRYPGANRALPVTEGRRKIRANTAVCPTAAIDALLTIPNAGNRRTITRQQKFLRPAESKETPL